MYVNYFLFGLKKIKGGKQGKYSSSIKKILGKSSLKQMQSKLTKIMRRLSNKKNVV